MRKFVPSVESPELSRTLSVKVGVDQNIAYHAVPAASEHTFLSSLPFKKKNSFQSISQFVLFKKMFMWISQQGDIRPFSFFFPQTQIDLYK